MSEPQYFLQIHRLIRWSAAIVGFVIAFGFPVFYAYVDYSRMTAETEFRADLLASDLAMFANAEGPVWPFGGHRLPEFVDEVDRDRKLKTVVTHILEGAEKTAAVVGPEQAWPVMTVRREIAAEGKVIGFVEMQLTLTRFLVKVGLALVVSSILGIVMYFICHRVPMKLLRRSTQALEQYQIKLIEEVDLRKAQAALAVRASEVKSDFLSHMSHEMRTPLNAIIGFSELMAMPGFGGLSAKQEEYLGDIRGSADYLLDLVNNLLDLSKIEQNQIELAEERFKTRELIGDAVKMLETQAQQKGLTTTLEIAGAAPELIRTDKGKLFQALLNVLSNAVRYTPDGGTVQVTAEGFGGSLKLSVSDTGIGMTAGEIEVAMEPFGQVRNAFTASVKGTGLGLPLANSFIEAIGGSLTIASRPGEGTVVTMVVPVVRKALPGGQNQDEAESQDAAE